MVETSVAIFFLESRGGEEREEREKRVKKGREKENGKNRIVGGEAKRGKANRRGEEKDYNLHILILSEGENLIAIKIVLTCHLQVLAPVTL